MLFNAHSADLRFTLPDERYAAAWVAVLDTANPDVAGRGPLKTGGQVDVEARSLLVLRHAE